MPLGLDLGNHFSFFGYECTFFSRLVCRFPAQSRVLANSGEKKDFHNVLLLGLPGGVLFAITKSGLENAVSYFKTKWERELRSSRFDDFSIKGSYIIPFLNEEEHYDIR